MQGDNEVSAGKGSKRRKETKQDRANIDKSKLWENIKKKNKEKK